MTERYNADLANGLGNLASRVLAMIGSYFDGKVPEPAADGAESDLPDVAKDSAGRYDAHIDRVELSPALAAIWDLVGRANQYLVEKEPWVIAKDEARRGELSSVLYASAEVLRILAVLIFPIMPRASGALWTQLGIEEGLESQRLPEAAAWGGLRPGTAVTKGESLFPRVEG
jgi:methionyl-tRNA synthetase